MRIKKGDQVRVLAGKDKGREGEISRVIPQRNAVIIEGVNQVKRHQKATSETMQAVSYTHSEPTRQEAI